MFDLQPCDSDEIALGFPEAISSFPVEKVLLYNTC